MVQLKFANYLIIIFDGNFKGLFLNNKLAMQKSGYLAMLSVCVYFEYQNTIFLLIITNRLAGLILLTRLQDNTSNV